MLEKTLLSIGLASVSGLRLRDTINWKHSSAAVMAQMKADLISDAACYPSYQRMYTDLNQVLGANPGTLFADDFTGQPALYSLNFVAGDGQSSIAGPSDADLVRDMEAITTWKRPGEIGTSGEEYNLWGSQGILPAGVNQGSLGDCWMLAACAALAENPERIKKVFSNQNDAGKTAGQNFYAFSFFMMGEPVYVFTDDSVPVTDAGDGYTFHSTGTRWQPFSTRPSANGAWWMPILEKGYAKYTNTYASLNGGNGWESLRAMTGMPVEGYKSADMSADDVYAKLQAADQKNYVMTAQCHNSMYGLISGHAYSLIGVNNGNLIVRNPWGNEKYTGPGSDQTDDGQFEVPLDIFVQTFTDFTILMYQDWQVTALGATTIGSDASLNYNIYNDQTQDVVVTFDLAAKRMAEQGCDQQFKTLNWATQTKDQDWTAASWNIWQASQGQNYHSMSSNLIFENLPEGWYSVGTKANWNDAGTPDADINVHVYSSLSPVHLYNGDQQVSSTGVTGFVGSGGGGGGGQQPAAPVAPAPAAPSGGGCTDGTALDPYGDSCAYYDANPTTCGVYDGYNQQGAYFSSLTECCGCGGGN